MVYRKEQLSQFFPDAFVNRVTHSYIDGDLVICVVHDITDPTVELYNGAQIEIDGKTKVVFAETFDAETFALGI